MLPALALLLALAPSAPADDGKFFSYDEALRCSAALRQAPAQAGPERRACMIAVAATYVEIEQNTLEPSRLLAAEDVAKHAFGAPATHEPGARAKIVADQRHAVIGAIRNRQWSVDGDHVWIVYDGYTKGCPVGPTFYVAERFTITDGLISEIVAPGIKMADSLPAECLPKPASGAR